MQVLWVRIQDPLKPMDLRPVSAVADEWKPKTRNSLARV